MNAWSTEIVVRFLDGGGTTAREKGEAMAHQIGAQFDDDGVPSPGSENYSLTGPYTQWIVRPITVRDADWNVIVSDPGISEPGEWWTLTFNTAWAGYEAAVASLEAAGVIQNPAQPSRVFAS